MMPSPRCPQPASPPWRPIPILGLLVVGLLTSTARGGSHTRHHREENLPTTLDRLASQAGRDLILDRRVPQTPTREIGETTDPLRTLEILAREVGMETFTVHPAGRRPLVVIGPGGEISRGSWTVETMVVLLSPPLLDELRSLGTVPVLEGVARPDFLEGAGPGLRTLVFEPADSRLHDRLPWGPVGAVRNLTYEVHSRDRYEVEVGGSLQVPLDSIPIHEAGGRSAREGTLREAMQIHPSRRSKGAVAIDARWLSAVSLTHESRTKPVVGPRGRVRFTMLEGGEALLWGLGTSKITVVEGSPDPLRRGRRLRRVRDRHRDPGPHSHPEMVRGLRIMVRFNP